MLEGILQRFKTGSETIKNNNQLLYTIFVALVIFVSFFYIVDRFINIALDSKERLVQVRVGSLQDAFVLFAYDALDDPDDLAAKMEEIVSMNPTIREFDVVRVGNGAMTVVASVNSNKVGTDAFVHPAISANAIFDPERSYTTEIFANNERLFSTARAILDEEGNTVALAVTTQTLSEADKQIDREIQTSLIAFVVIVIVLMYLFFRYARIIDYATLYRRLQEIDQLKDDFIAMASHELRSPLASIRGYNELIADAGLNDDQKEYASRVESSAAQLNDLVADMLDVSRIEQGRMQFEYVDFNIEEMIAEIVDAFRRVAEKKGLILKKEGLEEIVVHLDKSKTHRVIVNLVSNAIKYTKHGTVTVSHKKLDDMVEVRVSDTGIGISKEDQERLFEKFQRIRSKETEDIQGTGLGLWLSREIIRKQKGKVYVESIEGVGTHFVVHLPVTQSNE